MAFLFNGRYISAVSPLTCHTPSFSFHVISPPIPPPPCSFSSSLTLSTIQEESSNKFQEYVCVCLGRGVSEWTNEWVKEKERECLQMCVTPVPNHD